MEILLQTRPYTLVDGTKYLGLFLNPNGYNSRDWLWLLQRFDRKIKRWGWWWLSIGGHLTLVRVVLSNMVVYGFSLCNVPKTIINKIRMMIMAFIWSGEVKQFKYHLVCWEVISHPMEKVGWILKNMHLFSWDLREKILWLVIIGDNLWSKVIEEKYIHRTTTFQWVRSFKKPDRNISNIWVGLLGTFNLFSS